MAVNWLALLLMLGSWISLSTQARILGLMPSPFKSVNHYMTTLYRELAQRGHEVVVITSYAGKEKLPNYREIMTDSYDFLEMAEEGDYEDMAQSYFVVGQHHMWSTMLKITDLTLNSSAVRDFIRDDVSKFDVVICEELYQQAFYMFAHKYGAPLVLVHTFSHAHYLNNFIGNPLELAYESHEFISFFQPMDIWQRTKNVFTAVWDILIGPLYFRRHNAIAEKHFKDLPKPLPSVFDLEKNASLVLVNSHFTTDTARPLVPNVIEVGGMHISEAKPLPSELKEILDGAKNGVVFFSLGSIVKSADLQREKVEAFLKIFSGLKETVLLKWEDDNLPIRPANVVIRKWFPQNDILAHPNVRLFISHGGLLSVQEALYHGVPIVGMPVFADHFRIMQRVKLMGYGEQISIVDFKAAEVEATIHKVLKGQSYRAKIRELSSRYKDKPQSAMNTAVYWIEYVMRHKGANFMKPPSVWMPWYQYYLVDVAVLLFILSFLLFVNFVILVKLCSKLFGKTGKRVTSKKSDSKSE